MKQYLEPQDILDHGVEKGTARGRERYPYLEDSGLTFLKAFL